MVSGVLDMSLKTMTSNGFVKIIEQLQVNIKESTFTSSSEISLFDFAEKALGNLSAILRSEFTSEGDLHRVLANYLNDYWEKTRETCFSYTSQPDSFLTEFHLIIARELSGFDGAKSPYQYLMPTLELIPDQIGVFKSSSEDYALSEVIVSDDGKSLIPVELVEHFNPVTNTESWYSPYAAGVPALSANEKKRITYHSPSIQNFIAAFNYLRAAKLNSTTPLGHLERLQEALKAGGIMGDGTTYVAAPVANEGIVAFMEYWENLTPEECERLGNLQGGGKSLKEIIAILTKEDKKSLDCVNELQKTLGGLIDLNLAELSKGDSYIETCEQKFAEAKKQLNFSGKDPQTDYPFIPWLFANNSANPLKDLIKMKFEAGEALRNILLNGTYSFEEWLDFCKKLSPAQEEALKSIRDEIFAKIKREFKEQLAGVSFEDWLNRLKSLSLEKYQLVFEVMQEKFNQLEGDKHIDRFSYMVWSDSNALFGLLPFLSKQARLKLIGEVVSVSDWFSSWSSYKLTPKNILQIVKGLGNEAREFFYLYGIPWKLAALTSREWNTLLRGLSPQQIQYACSAASYEWHASIFKPTCFPEILRELNVEQAKAFFESIAPSNKMERRVECYDANTILSNLSPEHCVLFCKILKKEPFKLTPDRVLLDNQRLETNFAVYEELFKGKLFSLIKKGKDVTKLLSYLPFQALTEQHRKVFLREVKVGIQHLHGQASQYLLRIFPHLSSLEKKEFQQLLSRRYNNISFLSKLLKDLEPNEVESVYNLLEKQFNSLIKTPKSFSRLALKLESQQRLFLYDKLKEKLLPKVKTAKAFNTMCVSGIDLALKGKLFNDILLKNQFNFIKNPKDLIRLLFQLDPQQKAAFYNIKKLEWSAKVNSAEGFWWLIKDLDEAQKNEMLSTMLARLERLVRKPKDLYFILSQLSSERNITAFDVISKKIPKIIRQAKHFGQWIENHDDEQRAFIFNQIKNDLPKLFKKPYHLVNLSEHLSLEQCRSLYNSMKLKLADAINNFGKFKTLSRMLDSQKFSLLCEVLKEKLASLIKTAADFKKFTIALKPISIYALVKEKLPSLIKTVDDFKLVVSCLNEEDKTNLYQSKILLSCVNCSSILIELMKHLDFEQKMNFLFDLGKRIYDIFKTIEELKLFLQDEDLAQHRQGFIKAWGEHQQQKKEGFVACLTKQRKTGVGFFTKKDKYAQAICESNSFESVRLIDVRA